MCVDTLHKGDNDDDDYYYYDDDDDDDDDDDNNNNNNRNLCNIKVDMSFARNILYSSLLYILLPECQLYSGSRLL
jgi:hypothetical protein